MTTIYVVKGDTGGRDGEGSWLVKGFTDETKANDFALEAKRANDEAYKLLLERRRACNEYERQNRNMKADYSRPRGKELVITYNNGLTEGEFDAEWQRLYQETRLVANALDPRGEISEYTDYGVDYVEVDE